MFKKLLLAALGYVYHYRVRLAMALAIPFIALWILAFIILSQPSPGISFLTQILYLLFQMSVVLSTHRIILLGGDSVPTWGTRLWSRDVFRIAGYPILFGIVITPIAFVMGLVTALAVPASDAAGTGISPVIMSLFMLLVFALTTIVLMRFSLVFPALAVKEDHSLARSWKLTKDNKMLMFQAVILVPFVCSLPFLLLNLIENAQYFTLPFTLAVSVVGVAALSVAYSMITDRQIDMAAPSTSSKRENLSPSD